MNGLIERSSPGGRLWAMALALWIVLGLIGAGTVMAAHALAADLAGGAVAIGALVAIIRSVISRAGDAGAPGDPSVSR